MRSAKKERRSLNIGLNRIKGNLMERGAENRFVLDGEPYKRTGKGSDYEVGSGRRKRLVEVKSRGAKLSPLQRKTRKKKGKKYEVYRGLF